MNKHTGTSHLNECKLYIKQYMAAAIHQLGVNTLLCVFQAEKWQAESVSVLTIHNQVLTSQYRIYVPDIA